MSGKSEFAIETFSLTKAFKDWWGRTKVLAVDGLNLKVQYNEVFGLLGPNGSGKSTTLKMLLSLLHPTSGHSLVLGGDSSDPKISSRIGFLPEESYLYKYLTARESLDFYARLFGLPANIRKSRIDALLEMVGLTAMANRQVGTFSKGMARRIGLAQALINDPELLILDEPTSGMDPIGTRQIKDLIIELSKRGKTILLCSHLLADVEDVCDRICVMYGGKVQTEGHVRQLLQRTGKQQIMTDQLSDKAIDKIRDIIAAEKADCDITSPMDRLEEFFIRIVQQAQEKHQPTSGAMSTTSIGDFLKKSEPKAAGILDSLVKADLTTPKAAEPTEKVAPKTEKPQAADTELLSSLTAPEKPDLQTPESAKTETVSPAEPAKPQVDQDLLRSLMKDSANTKPQKESGEEDDA